MTQAKTKGEIIAEFASMKALEQCAYDLYSRISGDPEIADEKLRAVFAEIADYLQK